MRLITDGKCDLCKEPVPADSVFCPSCGANVVVKDRDDVNDDLETAATFFDSSPIFLPGYLKDSNEVQDDNDRENVENLDKENQDSVGQSRKSRSRISKPTLYFRNKRTILVAVIGGVLVSMVVVVVMNLASLKGAMNAFSIIQKATEESGRSLIKRASNRYTVEAIAPLDITVNDLGRVYDKNFNKLHGGKSKELFLNSRQHNVSELHAMEHRLIEIDDSLKLAANLKVWKISAGVEYGSDNRYLSYRVMQITHKIGFDEDVIQGDPPSVASFYLAEIYFGHLYEAVFWEDKKHLTAGVKAEVFDAEGSIEAFNKSRKLNLRVIGRGLVPKKKDAIFAKSRSEIEGSYSASSKAVPIMVSYRMMPGVSRVEKRKISYLEPTHDKAHILKDGTRITWKLPKGRYSVVVKDINTTNGVTVWWGNNECNENSGSVLSGTFKCRIKKETKLIIENPSIFNLGANEYVRIVIWKK